MTTLPLTDSRARAYREALEDQDRGPIAFVAVVPDAEDAAHGIHGVLGIAIANERGYTPVPVGWARYATITGAESHAGILNRDVLRLSPDEELRIVASTMGGRRYTPETHAEA